MKTKLDIVQTLQFACAAVAVLRALEFTDATMTYSDFGRAIGLVEDAWEPWHRQQVTDVLNLVAGNSTAFHRIVNANTGESL